MLKESFFLDRFRLSGNGFSECDNNKKIGKSSIHLQWYYDIILRLAFFTLFFFKQQIVLRKYTCEWKRKRTKDMQKKEGQKVQTTRCTLAEQNASKRLYCGVNVQFLPFFCVLGIISKCVYVKQKRRPTYQTK